MFCPAVITVILAASSLIKPASCFHWHQTSSLRKLERISKIPELQLLIKNHGEFSSSGNANAESSPSRNLVIAPIGVALLFADPSTAFATAQESLQLLEGYQTHTPDWITWSVLAYAGLTLYFRFFKFLASW
jgi:hypothetical protein